ncbi:hypothetical protein, partial [Sinorhizobium sp. 6-117]
ELARGLTTARREIEDLRVKAGGAIRSKAAALRARQAGEVALADAKQALDEERNKLGVHERDLAAARQSLTALEARANLATTEQAAAVEARKLAEATAGRAGEALSLESERGSSLARDLDAARRERDAAKEELTRVLAAQRAVLDERERGNGHELAAARREIEDLKTKAAGAIQSEAAARQAGEVALADAKRALDEERHKLGVHERDLAAARQSLTALEARANLAAAEQAAAVEARKLAEATASRAGEALALESEKGRSLARDLDAVRRERDAAKEELTKVLVAQRTALDERERGNGRDLAAARREMEDLKAKAAGAIQSEAAALKARQAGEVALADAKRALDEERLRLGAYERDLAAARQSLAALEARASLAAAEEAAAVEARKLAEATAGRAGEALALEFEKGRSLARDLDAVRRERDAATAELTRVLAAQRTALAERERANGRDLATRKERDIVKARAERRVQDIEQPKARAGNRTRERPKAAAPTGVQAARDPGSRKIRKVQVRKTTRVVRPATIALPDALLPERLPVSGLW